MKAESVRFEKVTKRFGSVVAVNRFTLQRGGVMLGTRVAVIKDGILQQVGTPEKVYFQLANTFVAPFIGALPCMVQKSL